MRSINIGYHILKKEFLLIKLSIIIPCYNESKSLPKLFDACYIACKGRSDIQFIFVNNGSNDDTQIVLEQLLCFEKYSFGKSILVPLNKGYGFGILQGLHIADGQILSWTHADLQTDPNDVISAYDHYKFELEANSCIVKGERKKRKLFDNIFTAGMSLLCSILLKQKLWDINAQPKIFNRIFLSNLKNAPFDFSLDLYLLFVANRLKYNINKFPVYFSNRKFGEAKGGGTLKGKLKLVKRTLNYVFELRNDIKKGNR
jgi:glycosyltransferase involved in cell wall biosynthesis